MKVHEGRSLVFFNGKIVTLDSNDKMATALFIRDGRIFAVGHDEEINGISKAETCYIDLKGKTMLPGFIDTHTHVGPASLSFHYMVDGRCPPNRKVGDILERIRQRVRETPKGEWVLANMSIFGDMKLSEKRYPTKGELDSVAPDHPVALLATAHTQVINSRALELAGINRESPDPPEGKLEREATTGDPSGILREGRHLLPIPAFSYEDLKEALRISLFDYWVKQGVTTVCSFGESPELKAYQELFNEGNLPLRVHSMPSDTLNRHELLESLISLGILPGLGNSWLKIGGVKIYTDGAFMGLSAATHEPYLNMPVEGYYGLFRRDPSTLNECVLKAHNAGLAICIHAIGDKAQDLALDAYKLALKQNPRSHRHRLEHLGNVMTSKEMIHRAKALDIIPVTTVEWLYAYGDFIEHYLGRKRKERSFVLRSILDAGLKPANCSDCRGADPFSINPFFSIWCAVTRQTFFGDRLVPEEAISVKEALRLYTTNAAFASFEEELKGSIEPGKFADLIVIDRDILTIPEDQIKDIKVDMTVIDGKIVYQR